MILRWLSTFSRPGPAGIFLGVLAMAALLNAIPGCTSDPAQAKSFKTVFDHYRDRENIEAISFPPGLVGIFLDESDPGQADLKRLMGDLSSFRMLILDNEHTQAAVNSSPAGGEGLSDEITRVEEIKEMVTGFTSRNGFEDLFRMQSGGQDIFLRILESEGQVREAILMLESGGSFYVIDLRGNISLELFSKFIEEGYLDHLTRLGEIDF